MPILYLSLIFAYHLSEVFMKILSSDIQLSSESQYHRSAEKTLQVLDKEGRVSTSTTQRKTVQEKEMQDSARFKTHGDTVSISRQSSGRGHVKYMGAAKKGGELNDDLMRNARAATVFEWAADTIEEVEGKYNGLLSALPLQPDSVLNRGIKVFDLRDTNPNFPNSTSLPSPSLSPITEEDKIRLESVPVNTTSFEGVTLSEGLALGIRGTVAPLWGGTRIALSRRLQTKYHEIENTQVQAGGVIQTADGRTIDFSLTIGMHREKKGEKVETFRAVDPLVINFAGTAAQLKSEKIEFDLDNDGKLEKISKLHEGSGFLALDINQDGEVNNGSELFGPSTGNGFQELSLYDKDKNGWIDENDPIWEDLKVWIQDDTEKGVLEKLSETGIGAIHLGSVASEFLLEDSDGRAAGKVRASGVALTEDGDVKSVQQVDLIV